MFGLALMRLRGQFVVNRCAFEGANHEENTDENERNTQNLAHVQKHAGFEGFLVVLDKFDEETCGKNTSHEQPEEKTFTMFDFALEVQSVQHNENDKITKRFVNLRGMRRFGVNRFETHLLDCVPVGDETETPGKVGDMSENFVVHQITHADEESGQRHREGESVESPAHGAFGDAFAVNPNR